MSDDDGRRVVAVLALLFIVLLTGCLTPFSSSGGTGDLTVEVAGEQQGRPLEGKTVTIKNDETGDVVYEGETGPNGQLTTTLEEGEYVVVTGETSDTVEVDEDGADIELEVAVSPPNTDEGNWRSCDFSRRGRVPTGRPPQKNPESLSVRLSSPSLR